MKHILFDLDGTLLPLRTADFVNAYLKLLSKVMADLIAPETFIPRLLHSTEAMLKNTSERTNEDVFIEHFFQDSYSEQDVIMKRFETFYKTEFKELKTCTQKNPYAVELLDHLSRNKIDVTIATNPVFPLIAIQERLRWIDIAHYDYKMITSYEIMKYCKPKVKYYEQILSYLNIAAEDCLMVGNDVQEDLSASELGIKTFLVEDFLIDNPHVPYKPDYRGSFVELKDFIIKAV